MGKFSNFNFLCGRCKFLPFPSTFTSLCAPDEHPSSTKSDIKNERIFTLQPWIISVVNIDWGTITLSTGDIVQSNTGMYMHGDLSIPWKHSLPLWLKGMMFYTTVSYRIAGFFRL